MNKNVRHNRLCVPAHGVCTTILWVSSLNKPLHLQFDDLHVFLTSSNSMITVHHPGILEFIAHMRVDGVQPPETVCSDQQFHGILIWEKLRQTLLVCATSSYYLLRQHRSCIYSLKLKGNDFWNFSKHGVYPDTAANVPCGYYYEGFKKCPSGDNAHRMRYYYRDGIVSRWNLWERRTVRSRL